MAKAKQTNPLVVMIERALVPGTFISYGKSWDFVQNLDAAKERLDAMVKAGQARQAVELYELFLAGCFDKANEVDDSGGNLGDFFHELFLSWIGARRRASSDTEETVRYILRWIDKDDYGFCYGIEGTVAKALDREGREFFTAHFERKLDTALAPLEGELRQSIHDYPWEVRKEVAALKLIYLAMTDLQSYVRLCERFVPSPKDCENIATLCTAKKRFGDALAWVEQGLQVESRQRWGNESSHGLDVRKRELLAKLGRREEALDGAWADFARDPSDFGYSELMKHVPKNERHEWHQRALHAAENAGAGGFIAICMATKEWERLATRVVAMKHEELESLSHYVTEPAAKGLVRRHPAAAAKLYRAMAMRIVNAGKSKYYAFALEHLRTAKRLYDKLGAAEEWRELTAIVRRDHSRKQGFMSSFEQIAAGGAPTRSKSFAELSRKRWKTQTSK